MFFCCCTSAPVETTAEFVTDVQPACAVIPDESTPFTCKVNRDDAKWGAVLDGWSDCIQVLSVEEGKIQEYNESAGDQEKIMPGSFIVQIDGKNVTKESKRSLQKMPEADLKIVRPTVFQVHIEKGKRPEGMGWGLMLHYQVKRSTCLRIRTVKEGGVAEFNKDAEMLVREGDFIIEVNGCRDDPEKMLEAFKGSDELDMTLMRLP